MPDGPGVWAQEREPVSTKSLYEGAGAEGARRGKGRRTLCLSMPQLRPPALTSEPEALCCGCGGKRP